MSGVGPDGATISTPNEYPLLEKSTAPTVTVIIEDDKLTALPTSTKLIVEAVITTSEDSSRESVIVTLLAAVKTQDPSTIWPCAQIETAEASIIAVANKAFIDLRISNSLTLAIFFFPPLNSHF
jgi:hypothetical protein